MPKLSVRPRAALFVVPKLSVPSSTMKLSLLLALVGAPGAVAYVDMCPGSGSSVHSKTVMETTFAVDSCAAVKAEMKERVHVYGGYEITGDEDAPTDRDEQGARTTLRLTRGDDALGLYFKPTNIDFSAKSKAHPPGCVVTACGETQSRSYQDDASNYCGIRNLYCASKEGCDIVLNEFPYEEKILTTLHSSVDAAHCNPTTM